MFQQPLICIEVRMRLIQLFVCSDLRACIIDSALFLNLQGILQWIWLKFNNLVQLLIFSILIAALISKKTIVVVFMNPANEA